MEAAGGDVEGGEGEDGGGEGGDGGDGGVADGAEEERGDGDVVGGVSGRGRNIVRDKFRQPARLAEGLGRGRGLIDSMGGKGKGV